MSRRFKWQRGGDSILIRKEPLYGKYCEKRETGTDESKVLVWEKLQKW